HSYTYDIPSPERLNVTSVTTERFFNVFMTASSSSGKYNTFTFGPASIVKYAGMPESRIVCTACITAIVESCQYVNGGVAPSVVACIFRQFASEILPNFSKSWPRMAALISAKSCGKLSNHPE